MTTSAANGHNALDTPVVLDEGEHRARARRRRARMRNDEVDQGQQARFQGGRTGIMAAGVLTILTSAWGTLIPFVQPMFGFHATGTPSLHWNAAHILLAVVPGVIGVAMGFVVLWAASQAVVGRTQTTLAWAGLITILSGAWFIIGPKA